MCRLTDPIHRLTMPEDIDVLVLREGTEGLTMSAYTDALSKRLPDHVIEHAKTPAEERKLAARARVISGTTIDENVLDAASNLDVFACTYAGTDHVPIDALRDRGVVVTNAGGIHAPGIAEQAIGQILVFARALHQGWRQEERHEWNHYQPGELSGSTVTVVGHGAIGSAVLERLDGFDVETIAIRHSPEKGVSADEVFGYEDDTVHNAFARSQYVVLACPLTDRTRALLDADALATLSPDAVVVNVARGSVIDTDALVDALQKSHIRGAALDVSDPEPLPPDHPLWDLSNCRITPHVGGHNPRHWERLADIVAHNVAVLDGIEDSFENRID